MIYISTALNAGQVITIPIPAWGTGKLKFLERSVLKTGKENVS